MVNLPSLYAVAKFLITLPSPARSSPNCALTIGPIAATWGDNSVSSCRSCSRAKGTGASAGARVFYQSYGTFSIWRESRGSSAGCQGVLWDPRDPLS